LYDLKKVAAEDARFMFPVLGGKEGVMSDNTLTKALRTLGYTGDVMTANGFHKRQCAQRSRGFAWTIPGPRLTLVTEAKSIPWPKERAVRGGTAGFASGQQ
jgi:hypothetical protein